MKLGRRDWIRRFVSIRFVVDIREALSSGPAPGCCLSEWQRKNFSICLLKSVRRGTFCLVFGNLFIFTSLCVELVFMVREAKKKQAPKRNFTALWSTKRLCFTHFYWLVKFIDCLRDFDTNLFSFSSPRFCFLLANTLLTKVRAQIPRLLPSPPPTDS